MVVPPGDSCHPARVTGGTGTARAGDATVVFAERPEQVVRRMLSEDESLHGLEVSAVPLEEAFLALTRGNAARPDPHP